MKLKYLVVQGFKSFRERQIIRFNRGITGIVGPNGCGKSNIVDALFWVMGTQSAKNLRGDSMKDLIFAGSAKYSPSSFAEVSLVLDNTDNKHIHIGNKIVRPSEIQLSRKLYRNGESEYRIGDIPCRLRDIQEVFMDTGAGAKSYSIIAQGEIDRLIQSRPIERRLMIEEVASVTKFKARKNESLRKIAASKENLDRLRDIQVEIEKNLQSFRKQAEKAEKAKDLKRKIQRDELIVSSNRVFDCLHTLKNGMIDIDKKTEDVENYKKERDSLEISLRKEYENRDIKFNLVNRLEGEYNEVSRKQASAEEKLKYLKSSLGEKIDRKQSIEKEKSELLKERKNYQLRYDDLEAERSNIIGQIDSIAEEENLKDFEIKFKQQNAELKLKENERLQIDKNINQLKQELSEVEQNIFKNESILENLADRLQEVTKGIQKVEEEYAGRSKLIIESQNAVSAALSVVSEAEAKAKEIKYNRENNFNRYKESEKKLEDCIRCQVRLEADLHALRQIQTHHKGPKEGTQNFLKNKKDGYALVGNLIQADDRYVKGVEVLLDYYINALVSSSTDYNDLYLWLEDNANQGIDFVVPSPTKIYENTLSYLKSKGLDEVVELKDIIEIPDEYSLALNNLLEGFYLTANLSNDQLKKIDTEINFKAIASFDGKIVINNLSGGKGLSFYEELKEPYSLIEINSRIQELAIMQEKQERELSKLEESVKSEKKNWEDSNREYDQAINELLEIKSDYAAKKSSLDEKLSIQEASNNGLDALSKAKIKTSKERLEALEKEEKLSSEQFILKDRIPKLIQNYKEINDQVENLKLDLRVKEGKLLERKIFAKRNKEQIDFVDNQINHLLNEIKLQENRISTNKTNLEKIDHAIEKFELDYQEMKSENKEQLMLLKEKESQLKILKNDELKKLLQDMQYREDSIKKITHEINKLEKECIGLDTALKQCLIDEEHIVRDIFEKYRIDLRKIIGHTLNYSEEDYACLKHLSLMDHIEDEDAKHKIEEIEYKFNRSYGKNLKEIEDKLKKHKSELLHLGDINWQAIESFEKQKVRYEFLGQQEYELKKSIEDLEKAVIHIDEKSKERFKAAFEAVNERFEKVFPVMFGGGTAHLKLINDIDSPECGVEITVRPPGKKMQNVNLMSGGEKALTAVSLIFSIFMVKPSPFCLLDEVDAPLDDINIGRFNDLLRKMSEDSQFILITHNKRTMELNDTLYGITMQEPGVSKAVSVELR